MPLYLSGVLKMCAISQSLKRTGSACLAGLLFAVLLTMSASEDIRAEEQVTPLYMGVFPRRNVDATKEMFRPLAQGLGQALKRPVILETSHDFAAFWQQVEAKRYDIVHYNQYHYVRSHKDHGYQVIAHNVEFGHAKISGAILVRKDAGINSLQDLKGKKIAFGGGRRAMLAYIITTHLLRNAGLKEGDYFEQFALNPYKACLATYYHQTAAAGAGDYVLELPSVQQEIDVDEMKYLAIGEKLAHLPWAVRAEHATTLAPTIKSYLISLKDSAAGREILQSAGLTDLIAAEDRDYDPHRRIISSVLGEEL
jgi:phosphonate transport system substrate-binding protein